MAISYVDIFGTDIPEAGKHLRSSNSCTSCSAFLDVSQNAKNIIFNRFLQLEDHQRLFTTVTTSSSESLQGSINVYSSRFSTIINSIDIFHIQYTTSLLDSNPEKEDWSLVGFLCHVRFNHHSPPRLSATLRTRALEFPHSEAVDAELEPKTGTALRACIGPSFRHRMPYAMRTGVELEIGR